MMVGIQRLINRSYDKPRYKYGIITTSRIKSPQLFLKDFGLDGTDYGFCLFVLLGPKETFDKLQRDDGYFRDFETPATPGTIYDCDIKKEYEGLFQFDPLSLKPTVTVADNNTVLKGLLLSRVLGCVGFKSSGYEYHPNDDACIRLDLTAFTSYLRGNGPRMIDLVLCNILQDHPSHPFLEQQGMVDQSTGKYIIMADCITEHNLIDYYVQKCGFSLTGEEDLLIQVGEDGRLRNNPYEDGIKATQNFHISFLKKCLSVNRNI
ncbi:uncharacterized protein KQ657_001874 [Scheffersomyces spartinae]|uniref:Uncharacterized protein n=1 Tax=Scheffersomyces spartinae TaxID=45513 RepID=A0A9P7V6V8_9ASCO|nr:uncharacterized protein KQ657_001874 [Scheffersomyces spartinae]KAG7192473.1 hypothetical protein KQ657_001874 [Scheffersomyces spartinae]